MKSYLTVVAALLLGSVLLELALTAHYRPSVALLERTAITEGKFYLSGQRNGWVPKVNDIPLVCDVFFGGKGLCRYKAMPLRVGSEITVAFAQVPTLLGTMPLVRSIDAQGVRIYSVTPAQAVQDYMRLCRDSLQFLPLATLFVFILCPLVFSAGFRSIVVRDALQSFSFALVFLLILYPLMFSSGVRGALMSWFGA